MGSYNWTRGAAANSENLNLISSPAVGAAGTPRGVRSIQTARGLVPGLAIDNASARRSARKCLTWDYGASFGASSTAAITG
jgi:hypothetical protein